MNRSRYASALLSVAAGVAATLLGAHAATAQEVQARAELIVNYYSAESGHSNEDKGDEQNHATSSFTITGSTRRFYIADIEGGQITDLREMTAAEIQQASVAPPFDSGSISSSNSSVITDNGKGVTTSTTYSGTYGNGASSTTLLTDGGLGLRIAVQATNLSGSCALQSPAATSNDCTAVPALGSLANVPQATGPGAGSLTWTVDALPGDMTAPPAPESHDAYMNFLMNPPWQGLRQSGNALTGYTLSLSQIRQFNLPLPDGGTQQASRSLMVEATIELKELKCLLNNQMLQNALASQVLTGPPPDLAQYLQANNETYQTSQTGPDAYSFKFVRQNVSHAEAGIPDQGFIMNGTVELVDRSYTVTATLTRAGDLTPSSKQIAIVQGCAVGGDTAPSLNMAFAEIFRGLGSETYGAFFSAAP